MELRKRQIWILKTIPYTMNHLSNFSSFINESVSGIHLRGMTDQLAKADSDLGLIKDDNARQIKVVLNKMIGVKDGRS